MIELGADLSQRDSSGYNALQVSALKVSLNLREMKVLLTQENEQCLRALLDTNKSQWKEMTNILTRGKNDEVEAMADQLKKLFEDGTGPKEKLRTLFVEKFNGLESIKTSLTDQRRSNERAIALIDLLITIFDGKPDYQEQFVGIGSISVITDILKNSGSLEVSGYGFDCLNILAQTNIDWAYTMFQNGLTDNIISALTRNDAVTLPLLTGAINLLAKMLRSNETVPAMIGEQIDIFSLLASCFDMVNADDPSEGSSLTASLLEVFGALLLCDANQTRVAQVPAIIRALLTLAMASQHRPLQLSAIMTIGSLAKDNRICCAALIEHGAAKTLQTVLDQTKSAIDIKAATLRALWTISGGELGEQKAIASLIGEELLISILQDTPLNSNADTHTLHQVACEALGVLCRGPRSRQKEVLAAGAAKVYLTILRSKNARVVIEVLRSMSLLCVGTGLMPDPNAQKILAQAAVGSSTTLRLLLNILIHSNTEVVSVAAAYTLSTMVLGNQKLRAELESDPDWTFLHIVKLFYSSENSVRLHAAAALAVFCFNSQRNIELIQVMRLVSLKSKFSLG